VKLVKQQQKEMEQLKRRHVKERSTMQKEQCAVIDKLVANHDKERSAREKLVKKVLKKTMSGYVCTVTVCVVAVALFLGRRLALRMLIFIELIACRGSSCGDGKLTTCESMQELVTFQQDKVRYIVTCVI
jgi:hypothetical protein